MHQQLSRSTQVGQLRVSGSLRISFLASRISASGIWRKGRFPRRNTQSHLPTCKLFLLGFLQRSPAASSGSSSSPKPSVYPSTFFRYIEVEILLDQQGPDV